MYKFNESSFDDLVFSLTEEEFKELLASVQKRQVSDILEEANLSVKATESERQIRCPYCESNLVSKYGQTKYKEQRYQCIKCQRTFVLLTDTIFSSMKISPYQFVTMLKMMMHNAQLALIAEICDVTEQTAFLWRHKIFSTVNDINTKTKLKTRIWIDEIYVNDVNAKYEFGELRKRGLSRDKKCILLGIDVYKNVFIKVMPNGKQNRKAILNALKDKIEPNSILVHDSEKSHNLLVSKLNLLEEKYVADSNDEVYLKAMNLINSFSSWVKRYYFRFVGMKQENLQDYLNWFVYLFKLKKR